MKHLILVLCSFMLTINVFSQQTDSKKLEDDVDFKEFFFVYIAHEEADAVDIISQRLKDMKNNADQYGNAYIFYLANGENPIIVKCNLEKENPQDFNLLIGELNNTISHSVDPNLDMKNILALLDTYDFVDAKGQMKYLSSTMDFYVGSDFWSLGYNESLLAKLYFLLDVPSLRKMGMDFVFRVNSYNNNFPKFEKGKPFGDKNLMGINNEIILQYTK